MKQILKERFKQLYPNKRLLAVQLDGFSHRLIYDDGKASSRPTFETYSAYTGDTGTIKEFFSGIGHSSYQGNAKEIIFVLPSER